MRTKRTGRMIVAAAALSAFAGATTFGAGVATADEMEPVVSGQEAIAQLGADLSTVAADAGLTAQELVHEFATDPELSVDPEGHLLYVDRGLLPEPGALPADTAAASFPYDQTFALHSKAGSKKTIYLDFTGFAVSGTAWNTAYNGGNPYSASPYDSDGDPNTFSEDEQDVVQEVWQMIAEDYATFDVDVTTEEPVQTRITRANAGDDEFGTRLVISNTDVIASGCNCGGIAYVGVFDAATNHGANQPAFVFTRTNKTAKFIAEAGSHEVGHNLGLLHDGVTGGAEYYAGHSSWAPIMGVGYSKDVVQWSKGEYKAANNKQDDLAVIATHGLTPRTDEAGDALPAAKFIPDTGAISVNGFITNAKDIDLYRFNAGGGELTVTVTPAAPSPDLNVDLQLLSIKGKKTFSTNDAAEMGAEISATVTEGTYYVRIDGSKSGTGANGFSDYASIGKYNLTITRELPTGSVPNVAPSPKVFIAANIVGIGPATIANTGSYDPDGDIASTSWDFGDGSAAALGSEVTHTYAAAGTYTVKMTVTDTDGATASKSVKVQVLPAVTVTTLTGGTTTVSGKTYAAATVKVVDAAGAPVLGAKVTLKWSGTKAGPGAGTTGADGTAVVKGPVATGSLTVSVAKVLVKAMAYNGQLAGSKTSISQAFS